MQKKSLETLKLAANCLLKSEERSAIRTALEEIHTIFTAITGVRGDRLEAHHNRETFLAGGVAISPHLAARCLFDPLRTVRFLRGINEAISELFRRFPGERIHIVYAGCGPYGTLVMPLLPLFESDQVRLTLIDIHQESLDGVQRIVNALDLGNYIDRFVLADAAVYRHPPSKRLHMVVCEAMEAGLAREPQLAIMRNMLPQIEEEGLFIPERVVVDACLSDSLVEDIGLLMHRDAYGYPAGQDHASIAERRPLERIMTLDAGAQDLLEGHHGFEPISLTKLELPHVDEPLDQFLLQTTVDIYGQYGFGPYDCELSFPLRLHGLDTVPHGVQVRFEYVFDRKPGLRYEMING